MKILLIITLLFTAILSAQDRPKIALVLSGGGARGGAHVGVLRVLEEKKIPIDLIIGTSMGSFVGGLYAAGKTPDEIDEMLTTTNWESYIRSEFVRKDTPMRVKEYDYTYNGRMRVGLNHKYEVSLPTGMLNRQPLLFKMLSQTQDVEHIRDFDKLPIPFRAIATDMQNGNEVILSGGSLSKSIYASSAIPGGLQPIEIDGKVLIDGGVSNNMPILLAKKMGADIIIAVDVSEHFDKNLNVTSYFGVLGQLVNILMRKNADFSISLMSKDDILITPNLDGYGGLDASKYAEIIKRGDDATREIYEERLQYLSLSDEEYNEYRKKYREAPAKAYRTIDEIIIQNYTSIGDESIRQRLHFKVGDMIDEDKIRKNLLHLYNMTLFDSVDYTLEKKDGKNILTVITEPSWNSTADLRFSINLEDDFSGHSAYSIKLGYTHKSINELGAEIRNDFEIGRRQKLHSEFFQPLDAMQRYYIKPSLTYEKFIDLIPIESVNQEVRLNYYGATLALGAHITTDYQFEVGLSHFREKNEADILLITNNTISTQEIIQRYESTPFYLSALVDDLDNYNFPSSGIKAQVSITKEFDFLGSDYKFTQAYVEIEKPFSYLENSLVAFFKSGITIDATNEILSIRDSFFLGGMFNLSGYKKYSLYDNNMIFGSLKYRYRLKDGGFFGSLSVPMYAGMTLESGGTWADGSRVRFDDIHLAGSVYIAADTFMGPFYLAYGNSGSTNQTFYLYLGEKF